MSSHDECKRDHQSHCEHIVDCAAKDAVFTVSQTEKIVQITSELDECLIKKIESIIPHDYSHQLEKIECEIDGLVIYDEKNSEEVEELHVKVEKVDCEVHKLDKEVDEVECVVHKLDKEVDEVECEVKVLSDKTGHALLSQAKELEHVSCQVLSLEKEVHCLEHEVKELACKDFKDERIDHILCAISAFCSHAELEKIEHELHELEKELKCLVFEDCRVDAILKRLICLEARKLEDCRVSALMCEIEKLEKQLACESAVNCRQQKSIDALYTQNVHQADEIKCLSEKVCAISAKLDRNSVALDNKIDRLEKEEYTDKRVDASQSAQIAALNSQLCKMQSEIDRLEKLVLIKPVHC